MEHNFSTIDLVQRPLRQTFYRHPPYRKGEQAFRQSLRVKVKLDIQWAMGQSDIQTLDPLVFALLEAVERGQSLRRAAVDCGVSYRHAWGMMRQWQDHLGSALVELERGRGASLSRLGRALLWSRRRAEARLRPAVDSFAAEIEQELTALTAESTPLRLVASHDLAIELLRERLLASGKFSFNMVYRGSLDAVRQLAAGHCDLAGYHVPDLAESRHIEADFRRLLPSDEFQSVRFVDRNQGLILPFGNPFGVRTISDLAGNGLRFLNRQAGSGTRLLFDELLDQADIQPTDIHGYKAEEFTHLAVAAMVASGAADASFGIQAAAERFGLDFVPMVREHYLLAFRKTKPVSARLAELLKLLQTDADLRTAINALPGYDASHIGQPWPPET